MMRSSAAKNPYFWAKAPDLLMKRQSGRGFFDLLRLLDLPRLGALRLRF
jgi:hypothetical protein